MDARPSLVARARSADLVVATGAELEIGWLPVLLQESGNAQDPAGRPGLFRGRARSCGCSRCRPASIARMGDIHPLGNPHVHLDPHNIAIVAQALSARLARARCGQRRVLSGARRGLPGALAGGHPRWEAQAAPLQAALASWSCTATRSYLCQWLGLREIAAIEPKPGMPPSAGYLGQLVSKLGRDAAADDPAQRLQRSEGGRLARRARARAGRAAAVYR